MKVGRKLDIWMTRKPRSEYKTDCDDYECKECGFVYDAASQDPPENATFHWVPHCPWCNAAMTSNPVNITSIYIALNMIRDNMVDDEDKWLDKVQTRARHLHGKEVHEYK